MNTFYLKFIVFTFISICFFTNVNGATMKPLAELKSKENSKVVNVLLSSEKVEITIMDALGHILVEDKISDGRNTTRPYNFNKLETGTYFIEISDQLRSTTQEIKVTNTDVEIDETVDVYFKPFFKQAYDYVDINMLIQEKSTSVELLDQGSNVLYSDTFSSIQLKKRLNIKALPSGIYTIKVTQGNKSYFHTINR